ncbi:MAG: multicopper oxidase domain-containing protein [Candidatus Eremiobacteraeota bacterium]|nr:multicopper oxidase domain-containing protein [Candidatus Eremiobacteraeota bacterium]MCW5866239.1 multicopper oxidase domain-containing protein [Candidatus Eremiobacteraeota bacterium]
MKRRDFLCQGLALGALLAGCGQNSGNDFFSSATNPTAPPELSPQRRLLPQPGVVASNNGVLELDLNVVLAQNKVGQSVLTTRTYNGLPVGPTMRVKPGDVLRIRLNNQLGANDDPIVNPNIPHHFNTTNLHTHGLHVSPKSPQDNVLIAVEPGEQFQYEIRIPSDHPGGTFWYHPHVHGSAGVQIMSGMLGAILVEGPLDSQLAALGIEESVVVLGDFHVDSSGQVPSLANPAVFLGSTTSIAVVNGQTQPGMTLPEGEVHRLRIINGSAFFERQLELDGHQLVVLAYDGLTLPQPEITNKLHLSAGGRADVLIRAGLPGTYSFQAAAYDQGFGPLPAQPFFLLNVVSSPAPDTTILPSLLPAVDLAPIGDGEIKRIRNLTFEVLPPAPGFPIGQFGMDGSFYDANRVDQQMTVGEAEEWIISNTSPEDHPFHIHINPFQLMSVNGVDLDSPRWHDTVLVPRNGSVRIRHRFRNFDGMALLHCHVLLHECQGMMQLFDIAPAQSSRSERARRRAKVRLAFRQMMGTQNRIEEMCAPRPIRRLRWS